MFIFFMDQLLIVFSIKWSCFMLVGVSSVYFSTHTKRTKWSLELLTGQQSCLGVQYCLSRPRTVFLTLEAELCLSIFSRAREQLCMTCFTNFILRPRRSDCWHQSIPCPSEYSSGRSWKWLKEKGLRCFRASRQCDLGHSGFRGSRELP